MVSYGETSALQMILCCLQCIVLLDGLARGLVRSREVLILTKKSQQLACRSTNLKITCNRDRWPSMQNTEGSRVQEEKT